jgi:hypothetical protein
MQPKLPDTRTRVSQRSVVRYKRSVGVLNLLEAVKDCEHICKDTVIDWNALIEEEKQKRIRIEQEIVAAKSIEKTGVGEGRRKGRLRREREQALLRGHEYDIASDNDSADDQDVTTEDDEEGDEYIGRFLYPLFIVYMITRLLLEHAIESITLENNVRPQHDFVTIGLVGMVVL